MTTAEIELFLSGKGVKPTANRILVARELMKASRPVSLGDLEQSTGFTMDRASIFRVLELFLSNNIVHGIEDGSRSIKYELCTASGHHSPSDQHVHFYCEQCRETYCLEATSVPEVEIPAGFIRRSVNYMIKGICRQCSAKQQ